MMLVNGKFKGQKFTAPLHLPNAAVMLDSLIMASIVMKEYERDYRPGYKDTVFAPFVQRWGASNVVPIDYLGKDADVKATVIFVPTGDIAGDIIVEFRGSESELVKDVFGTAILKSTDYIKTNLQFFPVSFKRVFSKTVWDALPAEAASMLAPLQVAAGWAFAVSKVADSMFAAINGVAKTHPNVMSYRVYFAGHSLGGAEATLAAALYATVYTNAPHLLAPGVGPVEAVYIFGSPTVGQSSFARYYDYTLGLKYNTLRWVYGFESSEQSITRINHHDHVADVPGRYPCGYVHVGQLLWVDAHMSSSSPVTDWKQRHTCSVGGDPDPAEFGITTLKSVTRETACRYLGDTQWGVIIGGVNVALAQPDLTRLLHDVKNTGFGVLIEEMTLGHGSYVAGLYDCVFQEPTYNYDFATECVNTVKFEPWVYGIEKTECERVCGKGLECWCTIIPSALAGQKVCKCPLPERRQKWGS